MLKLLSLAIRNCSRTSAKKFCLCAVGLRNDGAIVMSHNGGAQNQRVYPSHAEARLCRKLDVGSYVYVARTLKDGTVAMSRPCRTCMTRMKSVGVSRVYYTIGPGEYGRIDLNP